MASTSRPLSQTGAGLPSLVYVLYYLPSLSHKHQRLLPETSISLRPFGLRLWYHQIQHPLSVAYIMGCVYHITSPPRNNVVDLDFAHAEHYTLAYVANKFPGNDHSLLAAASKPVIPSP